MAGFGRTAQRIPAALEYALPLAASGKTGGKAPRRFCPAQNQKATLRQLADPQEAPAATQQSLYDVIERIQIWDGTRP